MPTAKTPKDKKILSKAYAICTSKLGTGPKREGCVRDLYKKLRS